MIYLVSSCQWEERICNLTMFVLHHDMLRYFLFFTICSLVCASQDSALTNSADGEMGDEPRLLREIDENVWDSVDKVCYDTTGVIGKIVDPEATTYLRLVEHTAFSSKHYSMFPSAASSLLNSKTFGSNRKTVIFIHGFIDRPDSFSGISFATSYKIHGDYNILALDSSKLIKIFYLKSATMVRYIGEALGWFLNDLISKGVPLENIHLVGHSLGAHIAGFAGKAYQTLNPGKKLPRITGLDPAGPCFLRENSEHRLDKDDADFVDIIHTNEGVYGINKTIGHVDFYPNGGGILQPGCIESVCSHNRVWMLYEESVMRPNAFIAVKCSSWEDFQDKKCNKNEKVVMGMNTPSNARGKYYLRTSVSFAFGLGDLGAKPPLFSGILG